MRAMRIIRSASREGGERMLPRVSVHRFCCAALTNIANYGRGMSINPVLPEQATRELRDALERGEAR